MSKFASFMMLKIVVCMGSDCIENVFSLVGLGCCHMLMSASMWCMGSSGKWGQGRTKCQMVMLWSRSGDGAIV